MNTTVRTRPGPRSNQVEKEIDFGLKDHKGRAIGYVIHTHEVDFAEVEPGSGGFPRAPGHCFAMQGTVTRNRVMYGASQPFHYFGSAAARDAEALKYHIRARDRARRTFASANR